LVGNIRAREESENKSSDPDADPRRHKAALHRNKTIFANAQRDSRIEENRACQP
jgi:hypothetical protein